MTYYTSESRSVITALLYNTFIKYIYIYVYVLNYSCVSGPLLTTWATSSNTFLRTFEQLASLRTSWFLLAKWVRLRRMASKLTRCQTVKYSESHPIEERQAGERERSTAEVTVTYNSHTSICTHPHLHTYIIYIYKLVWIMKSKVAGVETQFSPG